MKYNLPGRTSKIINQSKQCNNLRLLLDKYPPAEVIDKNEAIDKRKDTRGSWLHDVVTLANANPHTELSRAAYQRWKSYTGSLQAFHFEKDLDWRMVVGLGGNTVLETDITLHHLYGIPIIPGSALKGLARAYAVTEDSEVYIKDSNGKLVPSKKIETDHEIIHRIFGTQGVSGTQNQAGSVIFFDAVPKEGQATFILDIMNPHYPNYYQTGTEPPTNDQNPIPIPFLTLTETSFVFALALRNPESMKHEDDIDRALKWLQLALEKYGVGGKTSAGYGYFKKDRPDEQTSISSPEVSQIASTSGSTSSSVQQQKPAERIRPNIPTFRGGQDIKGNVIAPTDEIRQRVPEGATAFLSYESFPDRDLLIVISTEEAKNWKPGETRICLFDHEEVRNDCTLLICYPRPKTRDKKKGK